MREDCSALPLEQRIGIIGGGQLGKMMILEAKRLGFHCVTLDPDPHCPADGISDAHIVAAFTDVDAVMALSRQTDVVTFELEHVGRECLQALSDAQAVVRPAPSALLAIQDKFAQKTLLRDNGVPVPSFRAIRSAQDMADAGNAFGYPFMLKVCTGGYDGKGNALVSSEADAPGAFALLGGGRRALMAEAFVPFVKEISVLSCRGIQGDTQVYPIAENRHENSILIETRVPADVSADTAKTAQTLARRVLDAFRAVGVVCVEMFVTADGGVLVNEVAPRPHNTGHYTIEACAVNQFEQHIRAITGLPLVDPGMRGAAVMRNVLGEGSGTAAVYGVAEALRIDGVKLHIYGKRQTSPSRKMGHITAVAQTPREAAEKAARASGFVRVTAKEAGA